MELATARKLIKKLENKAAEKQTAIQQAERYYANQNDILFKKETRTDKTTTPCELQTIAYRMRGMVYLSTKKRVTWQVIRQPLTWDVTT